MSGTAFIALGAGCSVASLIEWRPLSIRETCVLLVPMRRASSPWLMDLYVHAYDEDLREAVNTLDRALDP